MVRNDTPLNDEQRAVIEKHIKLIFWFVYHYMDKYPWLDEADAMEIVFMAAVKAARTWKPGLSSFGTRLKYYVIGGFSGHQTGNSRKKRSGYTLVHPTEDMPMERLLGTDAVVDEDYDGIINDTGFWDRAMAIVTPHQRRVMTMYYQDGLSFGEIAEKLGVSDSAVSLSNRLGLDKLREAIANGTLYCDYVPNKRH